MAFVCSECQTYGSAYLGQTYNTAVEFIYEKPRNTVDGDNLKVMFAIEQLENGALAARALRTEYYEEIDTYGGPATY